MNQRLTRIIRTEEDVVGLTLSSSNFLARFGISLQEKNRCLTICSELAYNIVKYAGIGMVEIERVSDDGAPYMAIRSRDEGPGIPEVEEAMSDGFSSGGTLGQGLPGVRRLSDHFEIDSVVGNGTIVIAHVQIK